MQEKIEYKGYWWLPNNPDNPVAGILTYAPNDKILLELIGSFEPDKDPIEVITENKSEDIIHGLTSDSKKITLYNCHSSGSINFSCNFPIIRYNCQLIISGKHLETYKQKCFYKANVRVPELTHWCPPSTLKYEYHYNNEKDAVESIHISFKVKPKTFDSTQIDDNTELLLKGAVNYKGEFPSPKIEQYTYLEILKQNDASLQDFISNISLYEQFISLATLRSINCSTIYLHDKSVYQELINGKRIYKPIQIIYVQNDINKTPNPKSHDFLFNFNAIEPLHSQIIQKWYTDKKNLAPIRTHLINSINNKGYFSSIDFLIVIQAIEGFWWRFREDKYRKDNRIQKKERTALKTIIKKIVEEFNPINKVEGLDFNFESIVDSRHYYSHFMNKKDKPHTLDGLDLYNVICTET